MIKVEPRLQIRSKRLVAYTRFTGYHFRTEGQRKSAEKLKEVKTYTGELKLAARKRLAKCIDNLVLTTKEKRTWIDNPAKPGKKMPFQIAFTTLTIHNPYIKVEGKEAYKKLLAPFLQWLRRSQKCYLYIWKAELQMEREDCNQLHYHLLLGSFVHYDDIRRKWNELQRDAGYLDEYYSDHGHFNAPSTEIKNALEHEDISGYLMKEIGKVIQNPTGIGGKVWDCSANLKEMASFEVDTNKYADVVARLVREKKLEVAFSDRSCTVYRTHNYTPSAMLDRLDTYLFDEHITYYKTNDISEKIKPPPSVKVDAWDAVMTEYETITLSKNVLNPVNLLSVYINCAVEIPLQSNIFCSN